MINALRKRFILIAFLSLLITMTVIVGAINAAYIWRTTQHADAMIRMLYEQGSLAPADDDAYNVFPITAETPFETRYLIVYTDLEGSITQVDLEHIAAFDWEGAVESIQSIRSIQKSRGYVNQYRFAVFEHQEGQTIVVLDRHLQIQSLIMVFQISLLVALVCVFLVLVLLIVFSKRAIHPFVENWEKQKRFVTDAGHELKTPLTIISANTDVLELHGGQNQWTDSIRKQTSRMDHLIQQLIELAKMDERSEGKKHFRFTVSETVQEAVRTFEPVARAHQKYLCSDIQKDLHITGDPESIGRLVTVLLDNAVKYTDDGGTIEITLSKQGKTTTLAVSNTVQHLDDADLSRLFDRFYRTDKSRSRDTGGYGIGLSIAQAIVLKHRGKITASSSEGKRITFTVTLPG